MSRVDGPGRTLHRGCSNPAARRQWRSLYVQKPEGNQVKWVGYDPDVPLEP